MTPKIWLRFAHFMTFKLPLQVYCSTPTSDKRWIFESVIAVVSRRKLKVVYWACDNCVINHFAWSKYQKLNRCICLGNFISVNQVRLGWKHKAMGSEQIYCNAMPSGPVNQTTKEMQSWVKLRVFLYKHANQCQDVDSYQ